jgi:hypothetical protein
MVSMFTLGFFCLAGANGPGFFQSRQNVRRSRDFQSRFVQ